MTVTGIEKLQLAHNTEGFDCGKSELNTFLRRFALSNQRAHLTQTYVLSQGADVIAYYSLAVGQADHREAPSRVTQGLGRYPVPLMVLARLSVTKSEQGRGWGASLLKDALRRTAQASDIAGIRALFVHAKDEAARAFYEHFNCRPSPTDPYHRFLLMKDLVRSAGS